MVCIEETDAGVTEGKRRDGVGESVHNRDDKTEKGVIKVNNGSW